MTPLVDLLFDMPPHIPTLLHAPQIFKHLLESRGKVGMPKYLLVSFENLPKIDLLDFTQT